MGLGDESRDISLLLKQNMCSMDKHVLAECGQWGLKRGQKIVPLFVFRVWLFCIEPRGNVKYCISTMQNQLTLSTVIWQLIIISHRLAAGKTWSIKWICMQTLFEKKKKHDELNCLHIAVFNFSYQLSWTLEHIWIAPKETENSPDT